MAWSTPPACPPATTRPTCNLRRGTTLLAVARSASKFAIPLSPSLTTAKSTSHNYLPPVDNATDGTICQPAYTISLVVITTCPRRTRRTSSPAAKASCRMRLGRTRPAARRSPGHSRRSCPPRRRSPGSPVSPRRPTVSHTLPSSCSAPAAAHLHLR